MASRINQVFALVLVVVVLGGAAATDCDDKFDVSKVKSKNAGDKKAENAKEAKDSSESWTDWAKEKISEGLGLKAEEAKDTAERISDASIDAAKRSKDKVTETAKGK